MKYIELTQNKFAIVDDEDFESLNKFRWNFHICGYASRSVWSKDKKKYVVLLMHREILNANENEFVDHKNFNRLDNRKENIRICTKLQNNVNMCICTRNKTGYKGVTIHKPTGKIRASINKQGKTIHIGYFKTLKGAAKAYNEYATRLFGNFAYLNKI